MAEEGLADPGSLWELFERLVTLVRSYLRGSHDKSHVVQFPFGKMKKESLPIDGRIH